MVQFHYCNTCIVTEFFNLAQLSMSNYLITGGKQLHGTLTTNTSKNAAVVLLNAALLNRGTTTLRRVPKIEEVNRIIEVPTSIGVSLT